jgi:hypothetical protein
MAYNEPSNTVIDLTAAFLRSAVWHERLFLESEILYYEYFKGCTLFSDIP